MAEQLDNGNTKFTIEMRVEILKSCFVQRLLITEGEAGPKNGFIEKIEPVYEKMLYACKDEYEANEKPKLLKELQEQDKKKHEKLLLKMK